MKNTITTRELKTKIDQGTSLQLIEALPSHYFEQGHLPGALNFPHSVTDEEIQKTLPDFTTPLITYCTGPTCPNSARLAQRLQTLGYQNVCIYEEGKSGWLAGGNQIEK